MSELTLTTTVSTPSGKTYLKYLEKRQRTEVKSRRRTQNRTLSVVLCLLGHRLMTEGKKEEVDDIVHFVYKVSSLESQQIFQMECFQFDDDKRFIASPQMRLRQKVYK